jgi:hypothetical protein
MNEISTKPLVDILSDQLGKRVVMSGSDYVVLDTNSIVSQNDVDIAIIEQDRLIIVETQAQFRVERDLLLKATDVFMLVDKYNNLTATKQTNLTKYRQALRDSTAKWVLPTKLSWL